ncbi:MAG: DNA polymerase III subunit gamma/tau [Deltaproteobacteria bacterium]|nr:DNA polymerase III subunit gamma/tau [Deltaproteobacteria bacterium]
MSYLAIARKYRPASFSGIVGQDHVTRTLRNAIERDRVHHAYLFTGARGVGKTTAARALARALNCEQGPTADPCGACVSCREIAAGTSPDLIEIDGASNNSVEDVRDLRDKVGYAPTRGRRKIYLVDEVHMLSRGAFNALLKTLEEPPPHVVFIFATTEPHRIPDTILSRVQRFDFKRIPAGDVVGRLREIAQAEGVVVSDSGLRAIARAGEGSMRDAQSLLDQVISFGGSRVSDQEVVDALGLIDRAFLLDFLAALIAGQPDGALDVIDRVYALGHDLTVFSAELLEVLRNATFLHLSPGARAYMDVSEEELDALERAAEGADANQLSRLFTAMVAVHEEVSRAERPRMVLEMAVARLVTTRKLVPLDQLLTRLEDLERRLRQGGGPPQRRALQPELTGPQPPDRPTAGASATAGQRRPLAPPAPPVEGAPGQPEGAGGATTAPPRRSTPAPLAASSRGTDRGAPVTAPLPADAAQALDGDRPERGGSQAQALSPSSPQGTDEEVPLAPQQRGGAWAPVSDRRDAPVWLGQREDSPPAFEAAAAWRALSSGWRDDSVRYLPDGEPLLDGLTLTIKLEPGPQLSAGRFAVQRPEVRARVAQHYPRGTRLEVAPSRPIRLTPEELLDEARAHPSCRAVVGRLKGEVTRAGRPGRGEVSWTDST